ncbi:hypothetical protein K458DRAFT_106993 [Lentithecium fluviatile CBS 122367]|uniref:Uncharacterized protein n=1 Tax=Lentithecium fluviatile CBS 122367 TaxID=1168545 RepID=A0A6G1JJ25_9PLEO|nr:hypothetical protein K458DRAFT_106993 [Lentithecium fluviatile CBS 122367]
MLSTTAHLSTCSQPIMPRPPALSLTRTDTASATRRYIAAHRSCLRIQYRCCGTEPRCEQRGIRPIRVGRDVIADSSPRLPLRYPALQHASRCLAAALGVRLSFLTGQSHSGRGHHPQIGRKHAVLRAQLVSSPTTSSCHRVVFQVRHVVLALIGAPELQHPVSMQERSDCLVRIMLKQGLSFCSITTAHWQCFRFHFAVSQRPNLVWSYHMRAVVGEFAEFALKLAPGLRVQRAASRSYCDSFEWLLDFGRPSYRKVRTSVDI